MLGEFEAGSSREGMVLCDVEREDDGAWHFEVGGGTGRSGVSAAGLFT